MALELVATENGTRCLHTQSSFYIFFFVSFNFSFPSLPLFVLFCNTFCALGLPQVKILYPTCVFPCVLIIRLVLFLSVGVYLCATSVQVPTDALRGMSCLWQLKLQAIVGHLTCSMSKILTGLFKVIYILFYSLRNPKSQQPVLVQAY